MVVHVHSAVLVAMVGVVSWVHKGNSFKGNLSLLLSLCAGSQAICNFIEHVVHPVGKLAERASLDVKVNFDEAVGGIGASWVDGKLEVHLHTSKDAGVAGHLDSQEIVIVEKELLAPDLRRR